MIDQIIIFVNLVIFAIICMGNALWIIAFNRACQYETTSEIGHRDDRFNGINEETKMIFWRVKYYSEKWLGAFWSKPVYSCPTCMASLHGALPFWITALSITTIAPITVAYWIFYTLVLSGVATILNEG